MLDSILYFLSTVFMIVILILVHEVGHWWVARRFGIGIQRFSVGFGKPLWLKRFKNGSEFAFGRYLIGGYVKLTDTREAQVAESDRGKAFDLRPIWQRVLVLLAGSTANFLLAILLLTLMLSVGILQFKPIISEVEAGSIAAQAGVQPGSQIVTVDNKPVVGWQETLIAFFKRLGDQDLLQLTVLPPDSSVAQTKQLDLKTWEVDKRDPGPIQSLGMRPYLPDIPNVIKSIDRGSAAEELELQAGDRIVRLDGEPIQTWRDLTDQLEDVRSGALVQFTIEREEIEKVVEVRLPTTWFCPFVDKPLSRLGIQSQTVRWPADKLVHVQYAPHRALVEALVQSWEFAGFNLVMLGKLISGKLSIFSLGGPLSLFQGAFYALGQSVEVFIGFSALISLSLGVVNLLPLPGLDGGQLFFLVIEKIRRKPVSLAWQILMYRLGLIALVLFIVQITLNDLSRWC